MLFKDLTIGIIGRFEKPTNLEILDYYKKCGNLVISTWKGQDADDWATICDASIATSLEPEVDGTVQYKSFSAQVELICSALLYCKTPYFLKVRNDEEIWSIDKIYNQFIKDPDKVLACNVFWKDNDDQHVGDHFFMGQTDTLLAAFLAMSEDIMDKKIKRTCPEHMFHDYVVSVTNSNHTRDCFKLFNVETLDDYKISYRSQNRIWRKLINPVLNSEGIRNEL